jgi:flagellar motor protein MotB
MPSRTWVPWFWAVVLVVLAGCANNPMVLQSRLNNYEQQQATMTRQNQEYRDRIASLDRDNQELQATLAQSRQQTKVADDRLTAINEQLRSTSSQLSQLQAEKQEADKKTQALTASMHRQAGVSISPNNSFLQTLPAIHLPGVQEVRRDGDVIRVELAGNQLFEPGTARLRPGAATSIAGAAVEIRRTYPDQILGIEGHTDNDQIVGSQFHTSHELSVARAMAVYEILVGTGRYPATQLFVVGHGPNHPVVSNATPEGKQRNGRVELVVYPERKERD